MSPKKHTNRGYDDELRDLREHILRMAGRVEQMIADSVRALATSDTELASATIAADELVNVAELEADEMCLQLLARRQPMAGDLRFITLALKMVTDLERIADAAVSISKRVILLNGEPQLRSYSGVFRMAEIAQSMVRDAIDAFVGRDAELAADVIARDDEVDRLYHVEFRALLALMASDPGAIERGVHTQSVTKYLERIADHGTNLAELVQFMVNGKDMRHGGLRG
ncbi:MAG: phosphate transport system protein [Bradymonadia bacterium]|jgi:phosphate transport system protein